MAHTFADTASGNAQRQLLIAAAGQVGAARLLGRLKPSAALVLEDAAPGYVDTDAGFRITDLSGLPLPQFNGAMMSFDTDKALIVVDAAVGLSRRDLWAKALACLVGIPHVILAIDSLRLVEDDHARFAALRDELVGHAGDFACRRIDVVPVDFATGANIDSEVGRPAWYDGPSLRALVDEAIEPVVAAPDADLETSDQFSVHLCWLGTTPLLPGRHYLFDNGRERSQAQVSTLKHRYNPDTMEHQAAKLLAAGDIGYANLALADEIRYRPFAEDHGACRFRLLDPQSGAELAFGFINFGLRRATNIRWQKLAIDKQVRAAAKRQQPCLLWFTGLSGSGKSTVASLVEKKLHGLGKHTYVLDGDNVRHGLCRDLGFTDADRVENLRRIGETGKLFVDAGLIVLVAFISPFRAERQAAREMLDEGEFIEIFVDTPIAECERRDPKGLYRKARAGQLKNFTGIDSPYEPPATPEIRLDGAGATAEMLAEQIIRFMQERGLLATP